MTELYDVIIVGGGPGGLSAAIYTGRAELKTLLIEKGQYGGRIKDTMEIRNYPGVSYNSGEGLMHQFKQHAETFPSVEFLRSTVNDIKIIEGGFEVQTKRRGAFKTKSVVLSLGTKPRLIGVEGEVELSGHGVAFCATCDAEFFKGQEIYVVGAGDQAIEEADYLTKYASKVTIIVIHEAHHLDCNETAASKAYRNPKIDFIWNSTLKAIKGDGKVESIIVENIKTGQQQSLKTNGIFIFVGIHPQTEFISSRVKCNDKGFILTNQKCETSVPGIYAVGDVRDTYLRQVVTAASDGAIAAVALERYIKEDELLQEMLSNTSSKVAFIFYNSYELEQTTQPLQQLSQQLKQQGCVVYQQDISHQDLLFNRLGLNTTLSYAIYENGTLIEKNSKINVKES